jgi:cytochrome P450
MISYAAWQLSLNPVIQDNLRRELTSVLGTGAADLESIGKLPYLRAVVSEILRLYPPAYIIGREADKDFTVNGFQVKSGDQLVVPQWVVHRDDRWWHRPDEFRPERWFNGEVDQLPRGAYFPFGGGKRSCIGNHFAELTGQLVLATIVRGIEFSPVSDFKLKFIQGPTLRPKNGIPVVCRKLSDGNHV